MASATTYDEARERLARLAEARRPTLLPKHETFELEADDALPIEGPMLRPSGWPFPLAVSPRNVADVEEDRADQDDHSSVRIARGTVVGNGDDEHDPKDARQKGRESGQKRPG